MVMPVESYHLAEQLTLQSNSLCILYSGFISLGANFPEWSVLSFSRNFPDLEIHNPNNRKSHVSEPISHTKFAERSLRVYMSVWTPVIDKMFVSKLAQHSRRICSSCAHRKI